MNPTIKFIFMLIIPLFAIAAHAAEGLENLKMFKSGGLLHGKWQIEMLDRTDSSSLQKAMPTGKISICMDIAKQMAKQYQHDNSQANSCTHKVIKNSATNAELEVDCASGSHMHSTITREDNKTYLFDGTMTSKENTTRHIKARYTYLGECTGDGAVQFDKDSPACKMMREKSQGTDTAAMCAQAPENMRAQCEERFKQLQASCQ